MDNLFFTPFLAGLFIALVLPVIGTMLRLRDEWLAALGLAHLAGAGALTASATQTPPFIGAWLGSLVGAVAKPILGAQSNSAYGLMILAGWALTLLVAANTALGEALAHAMVDGQLFFATPRELTINITLALVALPAVRLLSPWLIQARFFVATSQAEARKREQQGLLFEALAASVIAAGLITLGLMASFALIFVPAWIAFRWAQNWRVAQWIAAGVGIVSYGLSFWLALTFDQPFGPVLVLTLLATMGITSRSSTFSN